MAGGHGLMAAGDRWQAKGLREMSREGAAIIVAATAIGGGATGLSNRGRWKCWLLENASGWREIGPAIGILAHPRSASGVGERGRYNGLDG